MLFWLLLGILPNLWVMFLLSLAVGIYGGSKLYGILSTRFPPSFWSNFHEALAVPLIMEDD